MVFNPYQSSLLRFVVGQYRRGVGRHRSALGQAHARVKLSAKVGTALIVLPVYVAARASVLARQTLRQAVSQWRLTALSPQVRKLLNFSGQESAQPMLQTLVAVGACLSLDQIDVLSKPGSLIVNGSGQSRWVRWARWRVAVRQLLSFDREVWSVGSSAGSSAELALERENLSFPVQITGVASDLRTRSLLLVLDYSAVWNGLSSDQQLRLQRQIMIFLHPKSINLLFKARALSRFSITGLVANWIGAGKQFIQSSYPVIEPSVVNGSGLILDGETDLEPLAIRRNEAISLSKVGDPETVSELAEHQQVRDAIEADVVSVIYVEHPLEKMLKWVDRILLCVETRWELIVQRTSVGTHE